MSYADHFHKHQISVQAHLKGRQEDNTTLPSSIFLPASHWTPLEKDLFFHGLTLYSRLRPDLIAEYIKTKSIFEVCVYLHTLQVATISRDHEPEASTRETMEPAIEMSELWVEYEEKMAAGLTPVDSCCRSVGYSEEQTQGNCSCGISNIDIIDAEPRSTPSNHEERQVCMGHLDSACLSVLESIIRESQIEDDDLNKAVLLEQGLGILPSAPTRALGKEFQSRPSNYNFSLRYPHQN
jgi:hypothetical protein